MTKNDKFDHGVVVFMFLSYLFNCHVLGLASTFMFWLTVIVFLSWILNRSFMR